MTHGGNWGLKRPTGPLGWRAVLPAAQCSQSGAALTRTGVQLYHFLHWCWFYWIFTILRTDSGLVTRFSKGSAHGVEAEQAHPGRAGRRRAGSKSYVKWENTGTWKLGQYPVCLFQRHIHAARNQSSVELDKWLSEAGPRREVFSVPNSSVPCFYIFSF